MTRTDSSFRFATLGMTDNRGVIGDKKRRLRRRFYPTLHHKKCHSERSEESHQLRIFLSFRFKIPLFLLKNVFCVYFQLLKNA
jgi:hypothetical protein